MTTRAYAPKIDPSRRPARDMELAINVGEPGNPAHREWESAGLATPDIDVIRGHRLARLRGELTSLDVAGAVLRDPLNIRYAIDLPNMQVWTLHNAARYCFVATEGPVVLFDFHGCLHLAKGLDLVDESRLATSWFYFSAGPNQYDRAGAWAVEIADLVRAHGGGNTRLAIDKCDPLGVDALKKEGIDLHVSEDFTEHARKIKHPEEIKAMRRAIHTSEVGMWTMWDTLRAGITENQLWSCLHQANIARGGEWIETRLLSSGPRSNPWFQECSDRVIEPGDIVAFDTDLVGPYGYCSDISRTWVEPSQEPTDEQRAIHDIALTHISRNMDVFHTGMTFRELSEKSHVLPNDCAANRYSAVVHGVGLCDEYPHVSYPQDIVKKGYDGVLEAGMCICFEAYIGREGGREGVKLERQALITEEGLEVLDTFPTDLQPG